MILRCFPEEYSLIREIINDAATSAYKGVIPADCWHEPYMSEKDLKSQIDEGVEFWCYKEQAQMLGVMGIQYKGDVTLIRHAYVRSAYRSKGIGSRLLKYLLTLTTTPVLIGTWASADWAIVFYQSHGFRLLQPWEAKALLFKYWTISVRQAEASVVLANVNWLNLIEHT